MQTIELNVQGMTCGGCVKHVTKALQAVSGVTQVEVDLASGRARVQGDLPTGAAPLIAALAQEDYAATLATSTGTTASPQPSSACHGQNGNQGGCCCR